MNFYFKTNNIAFELFVFVRALMVRILIGSEPIEAISWFLGLEALALLA